MGRNQPRKLGRDGHTSGFESSALRLELVRLDEGRAC